MLLQLLRPKQHKFAKRLSLQLLQQHICTSLLSICVRPQTGMAGATTPVSTTVPQPATLRSHGGWRAWDVVVPCAVGSVAVASYIATMYTTVAGGDSGELVTEACRLGTPHPPGYPLLTMLAAAFVRFAPGANAATRANLLSCICGGACAAVMSSIVARCCRHLGRWASYAGACCSALMFAWTPIVWRYVPWRASVRDPTSYVVCAAQATPHTSRCSR